jgi:hypothetical protein
MSFWRFIMKVDKAKLKQIIKEEVTRILENPEQKAPQAAGAQDAQKARAQIVLDKINSLAGKYIKDFAQKADDVAKREFLSVMARAIGVDIGQDVTRLKQTQTAQTKAAAGE